MLDVGAGAGATVGASAAVCAGAATAGAALAFEAANFSASAGVSPSSKSTAISALTFTPSVPAGIMILPIVPVRSVPQPPTLRRLYIARDADAAGDKAFATLSARATAVGIEVLALSPQQGDFNDDLQARSVNALRAALRPQLAPQDTERAGAVA